MHVTKCMYTSKIGKGKHMHKKSVLFWCTLLLSITGFLLLNRSKKVNSNVPLIDLVDPKSAATKIDLASTTSSHTAQLTLISILLGVIMGAVVASAPQAFYTPIVNAGIIDFDLRMLATLLAAVDLWIKYSWGIIVVRWPFSLPHNLIYTLVCTCMLGIAVSVNQINAWLFWSSMTCVAGSLAYFSNTWITIQEQKYRASYAARSILSPDPEPTAEEISVLKESSKAEAFIILIPVITIGCYMLLLHHHFAVPAIPGLGWGAFFVLFIIADVLYQGLVVMPRQRYGKTTQDV
jgi:hypothetical protein